VSPADKVIVITGAAGGLGLSYAHHLAKDGASVVLADRCDFGPDAKALAAGNPRCALVPADVSVEADAQDLASTTASRFGRIDVLINNAAIYPTLVRRPFEELNVAEWQEVLNVNVIGVFNCCRAVAPIMRSQGHGKIINIASNVVHKGMPFLLHYVASKGAVLAMTRGLARELGPSNITVNAIAPGYVLSDPKANPDSDHNRQAIARRALGRSQTPQDLHGVISFLSSSESDFMTGQTLIVDGGEVFS
jgi:NAD(P)-dependent dehydrogenase (short-subunit alcohol dehydrogenase family)